MIGQLYLKILKQCWLSFDEESMQKLLTQYLQDCQAIPLVMMRQRSGDSRVHGEDEKQQGTYRIPIIFPLFTVVIFYIKSRILHVHSLFVGRC